ncbi:MAG TPA: fatty acid desaturase [Chthoniobacterales bacterium]|nr:fatty acid desaturase [Chthoniobacterales bacterium]
MSTTRSTEVLSQAEQPTWVSRAAFPLLTAIYFSTEAALGVSVYLGWFWFSLLLMLFVSHVMHGMLIAFHEASHGLLRKNRRLNEIDGVIIGVMSFTSFNLYRAAHQLHHAQLATQRDEELWPFDIPGSPRWLRVLCAVLELTVGMFYTPFLFIRTFFRQGSPIRNTKVRRRIWSEFILTPVVWAGILGLVAVTGTWKYFLWLYLVPAFLAANMQSWRKYIEHVGLTGSTVNGSTRSIIANGPFGKFVALTLLHEPFHGVHHWRSGIPHAELPLFASELEPKHPDEVAPFPSYWHAFKHLFRNLADPKVGSQWLNPTS